MGERSLQVVFTERGRAELVEVSPSCSSSAAAARPGEREVAGRTLTSVVSTGTELGMQYLAESGFPHYPGYGAVFLVEEVGPAVRAVSVGDQAFCIGKPASHQRCDSGDLVRVPDAIPPESAVLTRMIAVGWANLVLTQVRPPAQVLITGLGAVGHYSAKVFAEAGYQVGVVDPRPDRRELLAGCGLAASFSSVPLGHECWQDRVALVLECSGVDSVLYATCKAVRTGGEVIVVGVPWDRTGERSNALRVRDLLWKVFWRSIRLRSGYEAEVPSQSVPSGSAGYRANCVSILDRIAAGGLVETGLYRRVSPDRCQDLYQELAAGAAPVLSSVFDWRLLPR